MATKRTRANGEGSIYPYRNGYAAYVWVTRPDGRQQRKYVYGKSRDEVHDKWIALQHQAKKGPVATRVPTVRAYLTYCLTEIVEPNLAPLTFATYEILARLYVTPGLGDKRLDKLRVRDVQIWINAVGRTCQCCAQGKDARRPENRRRCCALPRPVCCGDFPSARTVKGVRATLRAMLTQAQIEELVTKNVAAMVKLPPLRKRKAITWTSDQARKFLESARESGDSLYAAYVLVLVLGLRKGEVLGPLWTAVDWGGWDKPCDKHGEPYCEPCRDLFEVGLQVEKQIQRVKGKLLHRQTRPKSPTRRYRCQRSVLPRYGCASFNNSRQSREPGRRGRKPGLSSPHSSARRSSHVTSTVPGGRAARGPGFRRSVCTMPGVPAPPSWSTSTCTPVSRWRSSGTPTSRSRWRSIHRRRRRRPGMRLSDSARVWKVTKSNRKIAESSGSENDS